MNILPSDDPILDALILETTGFVISDDPPDKRNRYRQIDRQISVVIQRKEETGAEDDALLLALREAPRPRPGQKEIRTPRKLTLEQYQKASGRFGSGQYARVQRYARRVSNRAVNDLMKAGAVKPKLPELALAIADYLFEAIPGHIIIRAGGDAQISKFDRWALLAPKAVESIASAAAQSALGNWRPEYTEIQAARGRAGGKRSGRTPTWTEAELDLIANNMDWTVGEHTRLFAGKFKPRTIERMRKAARDLITPPEALRRTPTFEALQHPTVEPELLDPVEPTKAKRLVETETSQPTASAERRATQRWHRERNEVDPAAAAETERFWALKAAQREQHMRMQEANLASLRAPVPASASPLDTNTSTMVSAK